MLRKIDGVTSNEVLDDKIKEKVSFWPKNSRCKVLMSWWNYSFLFKLKLKNSFFAIVMIYT